MSRSKDLKNSAAKRESTYNISGASTALGLGLSTIFAAIERGELATVDGPIGKDGEPSRAIAAAALRAWRDKRVEKLAAETNPNTAGDAHAEAERLRSIII